MSPLSSISLHTPLETVGMRLQATEDVQQGLTQDDIDMYYEIWERYDEKTRDLSTTLDISRA